MNMNTQLSLKPVIQHINSLSGQINEYKNSDNLIKLLSIVDLTSLNTSDTTQKIVEMTDKVSNFKHYFPDLLNVAAICVYPSFISTVKKHLTDSNVKIASVGACFPSSQSFISVKTAECDLCVKKGADEIDIVISVGEFLSKNFQYVIHEISLIKSSIGVTKLKVILETGELQNIQNIYDASVLAIKSGADFIKTSTGKTSVSATPEAVYAMCTAIKEHYIETGVKIGIKPSGGMSTVDDALLYYSIVNEILGKEWLNSKLFRLGTSKMANRILDEIFVLLGKDNPYKNYF